METGRKLIQTKKWHLVSLHETNKVVSDDIGKFRCYNKKRAGVSDYSSHKGAKSPAMERAEEIQANLSPNFPNMIKLMLPSHVTGGFCLSLPRHFCDLHMPSEDAEMILEDKSGEEYKTKYLTGKGGLSGGWRRFSMLHNLIEGDAVVFQLVKPTKFKVYIVRSNSLDKVDGAPGHLYLEASATQMDFDAMVTHNSAEKHLDPLPLDIPHDNVRNDSQMGIKSGELMGSYYDFLEEIVSDDIGNSRCSKKNRVGISGYSSHKGAKSPAMERAEEIQANLSPNFPNMIKLMLPSHVTGCFCLSLPKRFCDLYMPSEDAEMILEDESGEEYKTKYLKGKSGLSGGWRGFSILHNLIEGDVVVFQLVKPIKFKVYIVRSNSLDKVDGAPGLLSLEASATQMDFDDMGTHSRAEKHLETLPRDIHHDNVRNDSQMVLYTCENDSDDLSSESLEAIRFSESIVDFKELNSVDSFTVSVNGLIIDSELSKHVRTKYYELCYSQKSFLHDNLLVGLNCKLVAGIISETVNIADAIKVFKVNTSREHLSTWYKTLKAFEDMGMNVGFLRAKLEKLLGIGSQFRRCREAGLQRVGQADEEMRNLQDKLVQVRKAGKRVDAGIEAMTVTAERHDNMFQHEVNAPSPLTDSDESVNGSNPLTLHGPPLLDADDSAHSSYSSSLKEPKQLNLRRLPIPIGLRFQAEVPEWTEAVNKGKPDEVEGDPKNLKWLGTRVWSVGGESTESSLKTIGKGRPASCSCVAPESSDCIKHHILVKRLHLHCEIGTAFFGWKFDDMGEVVANSWTWKEQKSFSVLRQKQLTYETSFWEEAYKCFPSKSKKSILSYYFNVFIPRRLSILTKTSLKQVDSDDEVEDDDHTVSQERCKTWSDASLKSYDVKNALFASIRCVMKGI